MAATFAALLTAHLLGESILQTEWMVERKRRILMFHAATVTMATYLLLGAFHWKILVATFLTHFIMDAIRVYRLSDSVASLLAAQSVHFAVVSGLAFWFPDAASDGWWIARLKPEVSRLYFAALCLSSGIILCVPGGGILIARLIKRFTREILESDIAGLTNGGRYIGWLERTLVLLLLLMDQPNGIGFLFAAKSILRFGEIKDQRQRRVAEYIIIGTFLSFGWALLISVLTQKSIKHWLP